MHYSELISVTAANKSLNEQIDFFVHLLLKSEVIAKVLDKSSQLGMPNWYLGAGCLCQTVWNELHGFDLSYGIKDCDLVYFDADRTSYEDEDIFIQKSHSLLKDLPIEVEVRNQARVHLWYKDHFGLSMEPYQSVEHAINSWPTTATSVGITIKDGQFVVYAPYGLNDLLAMIVRANKTQITKDIYEKKIERWAKIWPKLTIVPWG